MIFKTLTVLASLAAAALAAPSPQTDGPLVIFTPVTVFTCDPTSIQWSGGVGPYTLTVGEAGFAPPFPTLRDFGSVAGTSFTWDPVNIGPLTSIFYQVIDSTGAVAQSAPFTVQAGEDTSCVVD